VSPGVRSNYEIARCRKCGNIYDATKKATMPPCPKCGIVAYEWVTVQPVCDFCSDPLPMDGECWTFPCESFEYPFMLIEAGPDGVTGQTEGSANDWAACDTCYDLIEDGDREGLAKRSVDADIERNPNAAGHRHVLVAMTRAMHDKFFDHRNGEAFREKVADHES
jgi:predicted  nucleic acid-binding Zn-ribbon protein